VREGKGTKGSERVVGKAAGDECVFIPGEGPGLADEVGSDAIPDAASGEGGDKGKVMLRVDRVSVATRRPSAGIDLLR
jgi:hypothetical protein